MKKNCILSPISTLVGICLSLLSAGGQAISTTQLNATVAIDLPVPTCSISAPSSIKLESLTPGVDITWLPDIRIDVDCGGVAVKHIIYMMTSNKLTAQRDGLFLKRSKDDSDTNIQLYLEGRNGRKFTTQSYLPQAIATGAGSVTHPIKVRVQVPYDAQPGPVEGMVTFKMSIY